MSNRFVARVGPLLAVLALAQPAAAGPITWTYSLTVIPPGGADRLSLGQFVLNGADVSAFAPLPTPGPAGTHAGDATITLASLPHDAFTTSADPTAATAPEAADSFRVLLELNDATSGLRGFTYVNGTADLVGDDGDLTGGGEVFLRGNGRVMMQLGTSRYDIRTREANADGVSRLVADISVTGPGGPPIGVQTPEPATLALAGLGLAAVAVRRLRRR
jgi:hypothetical protein